MWCLFLLKALPVDEFDLEEMDLKWQVAMISMRLKKFYKNTGRKLQFDAKEPVGFYKTKVKCFNFHNTGHFARECRSKGNQESRRRDAGNTRYKIGHVEDEQANFALMAYSNSGSNTKNQFYNLKTKVEQGQKNHQAAIQDLETKFGRISDHQSSRPTGTLLSNTQTNPKPSTSNERPYRPPPARNEHVNAVFTCSGKTYDPPASPNTKTAVFLGNSEDEAKKVKKEAEPLPKKPTQTDTLPLKAYKPKIIYPQRLNKEKIEAQYAKFLDMVKEVRINVPLVDVLVGMPNYGKFLKDLVSNKIEYLALADLGASINLMSNSLYATLSGTTLKPTRMNFVILQMEEDDRVPQILGRPFLHTADAIIRGKNKELNLGIGEDRATFHIDKAMQYSHLNDDTCFRMDVIDEITKDELNALLNDSKPFLNTSEKISETPLDKEFDEFM
ncbi:reverse transcriptase domain-containing protein [Tanacetum coccineum]